MVKQLRWLKLLLFLVSVSALAGVASHTLKDFDGKTRNINEFIGKGQWVVLVAWSADCPICRRDIYHLTFFHDEHRKKDATVVGLSVDGYENKDKALDFIKVQSLNFPNLIGGPEDAGKISQSIFFGTPTLYFFSPEGKLMGQNAGEFTQDQVDRMLESYKLELAQQK